MKKYEKTVSLNETKTMASKKSRPQVTRKTIIVVVVILSIILYMAGVYSGLAANKIIKAQTEEEISQLAGYIDILETNLQNSQLEQSFMSSLTQEEQCEFSAITMRSLIDQLGGYWQQLPFRLEEYEKNNELSKEYLQLKNQYVQAALKTWIAVNTHYRQCKDAPQPLLYFYSLDCEVCTLQGEELDNLQTFYSEHDKDILIFTIDLNSSSAQNIVSYYHITQAPAIIFNDNVFQGKVYTVGELTNP